MRLCIDNREGELYKACVLQAQHLKIEIGMAPLPLGDAIIYDNDGVDKIIVERKTLHDLASSIKDGRYEEQGFRLNQCSVPNHNVFYLIEGNIAQYKPTKHLVERKALLSSFVSITYVKGFSLHRTETIAESAEWLVAYTEKIGRISQKNAHVNYVSVCSRAKKSNITPENIIPIMLSQIPGVSTSIAEAIVCKYPTIESILSASKEELYEIQLTTKTGKTRRISKPACDNLCLFLKSN
jgi:ERCC4-type nuclease